MNTIVNFLKDEEGASMAEYALLLGLITVAIAGVITLFGGRIRAVFVRASNVMQ
jgi:pilus assembly protein Flp/PilA